MNTRSFLLSFSSIALSGPLQAQTPWIPRPDLWVSDSTNDRIARVRDLDGDGDYDDAGESAIFYDDTLGPFALSNNNCVASTADGAVWVADTSQDFVLRMRDLNGDGDANDAGEAQEYFRSLTNAGGIEAQSINGLALSGNVVWAAVAQAGTTGKDYVLRLEDLNQDGDANDAGEAREYFVRSNMAVPGSSSNDALAQDVEVGNDGLIYYLEVGTSGVFAKGIYQLDDRDQNGVIDPQSEVFPYFIPAALPAIAFHWSLDEDADGYWYLPDTGNDVVWRGRDADASGSIDPLAEAVTWWTSPAPSLAWDAHLATDGNLYVSESQNNERIFRMHDDDASGTVTPGEAQTVYDELTSVGAPIGQIRGFALDAAWQQPWSLYCTPQQNSLGCITRMAGGLGWPSASHGSGFFLRAVDVRNNKPGLLLYTLGGRAATPFNGGTLCLGAPIRRVGGQSSGGSPAGNDCSGTLSYDFNVLIAAGTNPALVQGATVDAQFWSRDPGSPLGFTNLTDGLEFVILR